jgi:hypothetical protein
MIESELLVLLPLAALCLWLAIFLFTLVDHFVYRGTYGHFLMGLEAIERQAGASPAGVAAVAAHVRRAKTGYLARYLASAGSSPGPARAAAEEYVARSGAQTLVQRAAEPRPRRRARQVVALYALARIRHPEALALLENALRSPRPVLAYAALDMLDLHGGQGAAEVLLRALEAGVLPASRIATHLEQFGMDLTEVYLTRLEACDPKARYWIAYLLGKGRDRERSVATLERLLSDPAADVRKVSLAGLAALDAPATKEHAVRLLDDPVFFVRTQAARTLAHFPEPRVVQALGERLDDPHDAVQLAVKRSLVELGAVTLEHLPRIAMPSDPVTRAPGARLTHTHPHPALRPAPQAEVSHVR